MERIINTPTIQYTKYDPKCPFDVVESICDHNDGVYESDIRSILWDLYNDGLNDFGKEIMWAMEIKIHGRNAINFMRKGQEKKMDNFLKRYDKWAIKNKPKMIETKKEVKNEQYHNIFAIRNG